MKTCQGYEGEDDWDDEVDFLSGQWRPPEDDDCPECAGTGDIHGEVCPFCGGFGRA